MYFDQTDVSIPVLGPPQACEGSTSSEIATLTGPMGLIATSGHDVSGRLLSVTYAVTVRGTAS